MPDQSAESAAQRLRIPFLISMMLLTGVLNTLLTKYQDLQCVRDCDTADPKRFSQPVIQTYVLPSSSSPYRNRL